MIDVNRGWNLKTAIEGCKLLKQFKPTWIEEPVRWADDRRELKILSRKLIYQFLVVKAKILFLAVDH